MHATLLLCALAAPAPALRVPEGFTVTQYAGSELANDIHCMTVGPDGQVVVSGRGYVRLLVGEDTAKKALEFAGAPKDGAMGLFWEKDDLYVVGDGGLKVYRGAGGKGRTRPPELLFRCKTGGEHSAHAVLRGPDGWMYLIGGDGTGITEKTITGPLSPVKKPNAGCVLRFSPDWKQCEVYAHGFRNAYGMDFGCDGELYTFDSDNERCVSLPWYEGCRFYRVQCGGHHGWLGNRAPGKWRLPPHFLDVVPPVADLGRGSPTGVVCYKHAQFPKKYRGGFFLCDWTYGVVYFVALTRKGSSYTGKVEAFLKPVGDEGFAPVAAAVHPKTGDLFVAIGGRGTRGGVYRIRHKVGLKTLDMAEAKKLQPAARSLEHKRMTGGQVLFEVSSDDLHLRRQRVELAIRHFDQLSRPERLFRVNHNWGQEDPVLRMQVAALSACLKKKEAEKLQEAAVSGLALTTRYLARPHENVTGLLDSRVHPRIRQDAVRLVQRMLGGPPGRDHRGTIWEGYSCNSVEPAKTKLRAALRDAFPSGDALLDFELARTLAMIEDDSPAVLKAIARKFTEKSRPVEDVHYLSCLARLKAPRPKEATEATVRALLSLEPRLDRLKAARDTNWPIRLAELHAGLVERDPALNAALLASSRFGHPGHVVFARHKGIDRQKAARLFLKKAKGEGLVWNAELVRLVGTLPADESLPVLRKLWGEAGLDEGLLPILARHAREEDHGKLLAGLASARINTVRSALAGLERLEARAPDEVAPLVLALRQLPTDKSALPLRERLLARLEKATGHKEKSLAAWAEWAARKYPKLAAQLRSSDGVDMEAWGKRLARVAWEKGDGKRGEAVFTRASCASCHSGAAALGPDLRGVAGRFSRADLFTAILRPSKDVPPRYRLTQLTTVEGNVYQGVIVYEAVGSVILQTGPATTARVANRQVASKRLLPVSLMPVGLLDRLSDAELADLDAYLRSLKR